MNFLAHIYLSGNSDEMLAGNFIGDYVKGKAYLQYPGDIRRGILLHRDIDSFTDTHEATKECKNYVSSKYGLYSGIIVDIFYDHFLATNWTKYSPITLSEFAKRKYAILKQYFEIYPKDVKLFFPYFLRSNWLETYSSTSGIGSVLRRMSFRTSIPDHAGFAVEKLRENNEELKFLFFSFFDEIMDYVQTKYGIALSGE
jgi:acyl carrier protein phosphodiesterase